MVILLSEDLQTEIFKSIPSEFEFSGENINFSKRYANQMTESDLPCIVVSYVNTDIINYIYLNTLYNITNNSVESFTIEEDKDFYPFDEYTAYEILFVEGKMDGKYKEIDEDYYTFYKNDDESGIIFDLMPDIGSDCYVEYVHHKIRCEYGGEFTDRIQIDVVNTDYNKGDSFINGLRLNKYVVDKIKKFFMLQFDIDGISVRDWSDTRNLTNVIGEDYHYRNTFDVMIAYHDTYTKMYDSIEEVNYELKSQVV